MVISFACYGWCRTHLGVDVTTADIATDRGRVRGWRRRCRGNNDERADGLPLGSTRLEDMPVVGLSASSLSQPLLPHLAVAGGLRRMGVERLRGRSRERTRMSGTTALAGRCFALLRGRHAWGMQFVLSMEEKRSVCAERV